MTMTSHYFENQLVKLHYYKFGSGPKEMLCFHGYGMHGKQFELFEYGPLASQYTFYGFDLFFHKETRLKDQSLTAVKKGITKKELAELIAAFCEYEQIERFSVIGYSMGTHYATVIAEEMPARIDEYIAVAPSCLNPGMLTNYFSKSRTGNRILEKLALNKKALLAMLKLGKTLKFLDQVGYDILSKEFGTGELRFNFYACFTYLRFLETDEPRLLKALGDGNIRSIFIFGKNDKMYPPKIGTAFIPKLKHAEVIILDDNHEMINHNFASKLSALLV
ncbi:MAG: Alpha/beta hydrolase family protein [Mucilaginibacter sp.]|nr:Alpha/beta hydrolase family protein [Mucilaginibacter sp.]